MASGTLSQETTVHPTLAHGLAARRVKEFLGLVTLLGTVWVVALLGHAYGL